MGDCGLSDVDGPFLCLEIHHILLRKMDVTKEGDNKGIRLKAMIQKLDFSGIVIYDDDCRALQSSRVSQPQVQKRFRFE